MHVQQDKMKVKLPVSMVTITVQLLWTVWYQLRTASTRHRVVSHFQVGNHRAIMARCTQRRPATTSRIPKRRWSNQLTIWATYRAIIALHSFHKPHQTRWWCTLAIRAQRMAMWALCSTERTCQRWTKCRSETKTSCITRTNLCRKVNASFSRCVIRKWLRWAPQTCTAVVLMPLGCQLTLRNTPTKCLLSILLQTNHHERSNFSKSSSQTTTITWSKSTLKVNINIVRSRHQPKRWPPWMKCGSSAHALTVGNTLFLIWTFHLMVPVRAVLISKWFKRNA